MNCYSRIFVHMVWATRNREGLLTRRIADVLAQYLKSRAQQCNCTLLAIGTMPDHVHAAVRIHPAVSIARLAQELKGASAHHINHRTDRGQSPLLRWQSGYGAFTFAEREAPSVLAYVRSQPERHARDLWISHDTLVSICELDSRDQVLVDDWETCGHDDPIDTRQLVRVCRS